MDGFASANVGIISHLKEEGHGAQFLDRLFQLSEFLSHLHSLVVTMSQKPSVMQSRQIGPEALTGDMLKRSSTID